ncbi:MAG: 1-acyl-sn-glycerol-3-phosphate acyltransferase [Deltaproteobacteria bacterium]|nr:1-acyl-sn-glycerol-3-phosphate acyltransferase [Deltaproteobacteria bacterium]
MAHPLVDFITAFEPRDLLRAAPPLGMWPVLRVILGGEPDEAGEPRLEDRDPDFVARFFEGFWWFAQRYFRHRVHGVENVPARGAALIVGNHSGGLTPTDWALTLAAIFKAHGPARAVYGLGHDFLQWHPVFRKYGRKLGGLRAGHEVAHEVFARGHLAIVYPGSDFDSFRPFAERDRVVLAGRTGFIELALREQVPIVPVVTAGAQEQYVVLTRGEGLARLLDMKRRLRSNVFPLGFSFPWGFGPTLLPYVPLPTQITTAFLPPMAWPDLGPEAAAVRRCYDEVEAALQARLDALTLGRVPWLGQP